MWASIIAAAVSAISGLIGNRIAKKKAAANKASAAGDIGNAVANMATSIGGAIAADRQIKQQQKFNSTEAQKARDWNLEMDSSKYQRTVADMQAAGVNPALAMSGNISTQATSSAQAQSESGINAITQLAALSGQMRLQQQQLKQEKELKSRELDIKQQETDAKVKNTNMQTDLLEIEKEYKRKEKDLQIESYELQNNLTRKQASEIDERIKNIKASTELLINQAATEVDKQLLLASQSALADANAYEIISLLPFKQNLMEAQTKNQKAAAGLALVEKMWKKGLIDAGYLKNMISLQDADIDRKELDNAVMQFEAGMRNGTYFDNSTWMGKFSNFIAAGAAQAGKIIDMLVPKFFKPQ